MIDGQKVFIDLNKWCQHIVSAAHVIALIIILAHAVWYFAARNILARPPDVYLRNYIIIPAISFFMLNLLVDLYVRSERFSLLSKEYLSLSLLVIYSLYFSLAHPIARVLLSSYIFPIFVSTIFFNVKLTRRIFFMSVIAVLLLGTKLYFTGELDAFMIMQIFVLCFMFFCSYLLAKILIRFAEQNIEAITSANEAARSNEFAFLQMQIKPHFIHNTINTIVSFCYTDSEKAARTLVDFSKYLRLVFDVDNEQMKVTLQKEIEVVKSYVEIEKARFGERINVDYDIEPDLLSMEIPSFCIQPLVENAIKHGLCKNDSGGTILISAKKTKRVITIRIRDTGMGMSAEKLDRLKNIDSSGEGVGLFNVSRRIKSWRGAQFDIQSYEGEGTVVTIEVLDGNQ